MSQRDEETSSVTSFEDVGAGRVVSDKGAGPAVVKDLVIRAKRNDAEEKIPDVQDVVQYRDVSGRLVNSKFFMLYFPRRSPRSLVSPCW